MFQHSPNPLCLISVLSPSAKTTSLLTSVRGMQFSPVVNLPSMAPRSLSPPTLDTPHAVRPSPSYLHRSPRPLYAQANLFIYPAKGHVVYVHAGALTNDLDVNIIVHIYCCTDRHISTGHWIRFLSLLEQITTKCSALSNTHLLSFSSGGHKSGVDLTRLKPRCQQDFFFYGGRDPLSCSFGLSAELSFLLLEDWGPHFLAGFQLSHSQHLEPLPSLPHDSPSSKTTAVPSDPSPVLCLCQAALSDHNGKGFRLLRIDMIRLVPPILYRLIFPLASLVAQMVKNPPAMQETWVQSLGWEDPLEKGMATHSSIPTWRIP